MLGKVLISGGGRLGAVSLEREKIEQETRIEGCGAVCRRKETIFAAGEYDRVVYRLDENFLITGVYAGGPGMEALCISGDGERLYMLLRDADSVMMLSAADGLPIMLSRAGVCPMGMRLDEEERYLIIAGGKDGKVILLCPQTLRTLHAVHEEGVCVDALIFRQTLCALYMTETMHSRLVLSSAGGRYRSFSLQGMPGSLCAVGDELLVSVGELVYAFDLRAMRIKRKLPTGGVCGKLFSADGRLLLLSQVHEMLYLFDGCQFKPLCRNVGHAAVSG